MKLSQYLSLVTLVFIGGAVLLNHNTIVKYLINKLPDPVQDTRVSNSEMATPKTEKAEPAAKKIEIALSNNNIDRILASQETQFKRCHQNRIPEVGVIKGLVLLGVTILPNGNVADVSMLQSNIEDPTVIQCLVRAIYQVKFSPFEGKPFQRAYPIEFQ